MDVITKINKLIEEEIEFAKGINPQMGFGMMQIQRNISEMEEYKNKGLVSDGYHTFDELYHHRMVLFSIICNTYKEKSWKSWKHHNGTMYDDYFIVGITTKKGDYTYHYHKDNWDMFDVKEVLNAPAWDGHKPSDIDRLYSLL